MTLCVDRSHALLKPVTANFRRCRAFILAARRSPSRTCWLERSIDAWPVLGQCSFPVSPAAFACVDDERRPGRAALHFRTIGNAVGVEGMGGRAEIHFGRALVRCRKSGCRVCFEK